MPWMKHPQLGMLTTWTAGQVLWNTHQEERARLALIPGVSGSKIPRNNTAMEGALWRELRSYDYAAKLNQYAYEIPPVPLSWEDWELSHLSADFNLINTHETVIVSHLNNLENKPLHLSCYPKYFSNKSCLACTIWNTCTDHSYFICTWYFLIDFNCLELSWETIHIYKVKDLLLYIYIYILLPCWLRQ